MHVGHVTPSTKQLLMPPHTCVAWRARRRKTEASRAQVAQIVQGTAPLPCPCRSACRRLGETPTRICRTLAAAHAATPPHTHPNQTEIKGHCTVLDAVPEQYACPVCLDTEADNGAMKVRGARLAGCARAHLLPPHPHPHPTQPPFTTATASTHAPARSGVSGARTRCAPTVSPAWPRSSPPRSRRAVRSAGSASSPRLAAPAAATATRSATRVTRPAAAAAAAQGCRATWRWGCPTAASAAAAEPQLLSSPAGVERYL